MTAKEFFQRVLKAEKALKILNAKLEHFEELGFSLGGGRDDGMPGSSNRSASRVELAAVGAVDALYSIQRQQREYMAIIGRAEGIIQRIPQEKYQNILSYHYLLGKSFSWISDELGYKDPNSVYRAHGWALYEAQKILNKMEEENGQIS